MGNASEPRSQTDWLPLNTRKCSPNLRTIFWLLHNQYWSSLLRWPFSLKYIDILNSKWCFQVERWHMENILYVEIDKVKFSTELSSYLSSSWTWCSPQSSIRYHRSEFPQSLESRHVLTLQLFHQSSSGWLTPGSLCDLYHRNLVQGKQLGLINVLLKNCLCCSIISTLPLYSAVGAFITSHFPGKGWSNMLWQFFPK